MDTLATYGAQTREPCYLLTTEEKQGADFLGAKHSDLYRCSFICPSLYPSLLVILLSPARLSRLAS